MQKKAFLIVPNSKDIWVKPKHPHLGIGYLASSLLKAGHDVRVLDMRFDYSTQYLIKILDKYKPDLVGITCTSSDYEKTKKIINEIKRKGHKIVIGGPHATVRKEEILKETNTDFLIVGEGENSIVELIENLKNPAKVRGITYRLGKKIIFTGEREKIKNLDNLPFPAYELFELNKYMEKKLPIITSRGCPYHCIYCSIHLSMGRGFRARSAENVIDEIEHWYKRGYSSFYINDDCFTFDIKRAERVCDLIINKKIKIKWELRNGIRIDRVNENLLIKMKKAGCTYIAFGIESGNQDVLNKMKKGITISQVENVIKLTKKVGISRSGYFVIGLPGDNYKRFQKTLKFALSLPLDEIRFCSAIPYYGTELLGWIKEGNGRLLKSKHLEGVNRWKPNIIFDTPDFSKKEREMAFEKATCYVMKYLMIREMGSFLGTIAWLVWLPRPTRNFIMNIGKKVWYLKRVLINRQI